MLSNWTNLVPLCCMLLFCDSFTNGFRPIQTCARHRLIVKGQFERCHLHDMKPSGAVSREHFKQRLRCAPGLTIPENKKGIRMRWNRALEDMKRNPWSYITIPIVAAMVGYITNYVGVKMLFYPIKWRGIPFYRWENQPLGIIGWQGIVPAKRVAMASKMVDVTISRLLSIPEVFSQLQPHKLAPLLAPTISGSVLNGLVPSPILKLFLRKTSRDVIRNIESVVDIKSIVVTGLTTDPTTFGSFFQKVGAKELRFLIESGVGFGFLLGLLQMVQWMFFPYNWTLPIGGAVVGYITNWIALKWIFEPLYPTRVGPFILQGIEIIPQQNSAIIMYLLLHIISLLKSPFPYFKLQECSSKGKKKFLVNSANTLRRMF